MKRRQEEQAIEKLTKRRRSTDIEQPAIKTQEERSGVRRDRESEDPPPEEPAEKYMCIEAVMSAEQFHIVDEKEQQITPTEAQLEYELPDLNFEEIGRLARLKGPDPELSTAGVKKKLETLIKKGVHEEISPKGVKQGTRIIGTTVVLTPKSPTRVKGRICAQDFLAEHRDDAFAPTLVATSLKIVLNLMQHRRWRG